MSRFAIRPMTGADAHAIAGWRYPEPYSFYEWERDPEDLAELLDPSEWGRRYFASDLVGHGLAGFFVFKPTADVVEIGLGLRPDLTGRGMGGTYLEAGLRFAVGTFGTVRFALAVAAFNARAITVYRRAGRDPLWIGPRRGVGCKYGVS